MINIYCDESCHLENDKSDVMALGAIQCDEEIKDKVYKEIREIKVRHGLSSWTEVKWTKISNSQKELYKDLIDYFFSNEGLKLRILVAVDKKSLNNSKYNGGDYNTWYYKMYYQLLDNIIRKSKSYKIFIDIKDTKGGPRVMKLHDILCNDRRDYKKEVIKDIKQINSKRSELLQLVDLFIGAATYIHRKEHLKPGANNAKVEIIDMIQNKYGVNLLMKTDPYEEKFNIFIWTPRRY